MLPSVTITKSDGNTGVVKPSADGILAIIAPSEKGDLNTPSAHTRVSNALAEFGYGRLVEDAAYDLAVAKKPAVLIRADASSSPSYGTITVDGEPESGDSEITAGSSDPLDDFDVLLTFVTAGTIGTAGISYTYSLDGGKTTSGKLALGVLTQIDIPNTGLSFLLGAGDVAAGETASCPITGPKMTNTDLTAALEALRTYSGQWDAVFIDIEADDATVTEVDLWLSGLEAVGKFKTAVLNAVARDADSETEAQYLTAMTEAFAESSSKSIVMCADAGRTVSTLRGIRTVRPVALGVAARGMAIDISQDAAYVAGGPIVGFSIADDRGNPQYHDEALFPGLDDIRLTTLRSFDGRQGAYCTNANLLSPSGSDYVYWQHARVMNKACEIAFQTLSNRLSQGIRKDVATGFILEEDATEIEALVQAELDKQLVRPSRVSGAVFVLSRTDDLSSNQGAVLTGEVQVSALAYVKTFDITTRFVKTIAVSA